MSSERLIIEPGLDHMVPIHFVIEEGLATWHEVMHEMNVMEVEHMIHVHTVRLAQRERARRNRDHK